MSFRIRVREKQDNSNEIVSFLDGEERSRITLIGHALYEKGFDGLQTIIFMDVWKRECCLIILDKESGDVRWIPLDGIPNEVCGIELKDNVLCLHLSGEDSSCLVEFNLAGKAEGETVKNLNDV